MSNDLNDILGIDSSPNDSFPKKQRKAQVSSNLLDVEIVYSPSRITNYAALKGLGKILKILAWIIGVGGVLSLLSSLGHLDSGGYYGGEPDIAFYILVASGLINLFTAAIFLIFSESINVILDIEANTRQSAKTLGKILDAQ